MEAILEKAQAEANKSGARMYVFRSVNVNGLESGWFNSSGKNDHPNAELYKVVEPQ